MIKHLSLLLMMTGCYAPLTIIDAEVETAFTNASSEDLVAEICVSDDGISFTNEECELTRLITAGESITSSSVRAGVVQGDLFGIQVSAVNANGDKYCWNDCEWKQYSAEEQVDIVITLRDEDCCF